MKTYTQTPSTAQPVVAPPALIAQARAGLLDHLSRADSPQQSGLSTSNGAGILPAILEQVATLLHAEGVALTMFDLEASETVVDLAYGAWIDQENQPLRTAQSPRTWPANPYGVPPQAEYVACIPLFVQDTTIGTLSVRCSQSIGEEDLRLLTAMGNIAANAVNDQYRVSQEQQHTYDSTLEGWLHALKLRDNETQEHTRRVTEMTVELAQALGVRGTELVHMRRGALLHDIGKLAISDSILLKPGPLTDDEWALMRQHPVYAYELLAPISFLRPALDIPRYHHEKWDGSGYPYRLKGETIPLAARIFALVDVWDALRFDRPYRKAWPDQRVQEHIEKLAGSHFDPALVPVFLWLLREQGDRLNPQSEPPPRTPHELPRILHDLPRDQGRWRRQFALA